MKRYAPLRCTFTRLSLLASEFLGRQGAGRPEDLRTEGCAGCHTPPLYTSHKVTLAKGFTPPKDKPASLDVLPISVDTDPGLALATRKGTGYYEIPSLKGLWYRGHYLHDGSAASLEEMFDPGRLKEIHVPGGWLPPGSSFAKTVRRSVRNRVVR
jgi:hypothetical protein